MSDRRVAAASLVLAFGLAGPVGATTLLDAIRMACATNPALRAQRADLAAVGEGYVQARANLGPQASLTGQAGYSIARVASGGLLGAGGTYRGGTGQGDLSVVQPIFSFGANAAQVRGARDSVVAGREDLRRVESETIYKVITAYLDVRRDRQTLAILREEIGDLEREFEETKARSELGQLTRTDLAETEARLLSARSQLDIARGRLTSSNAEYQAVVGENPDELAPEPDLPGLPATLDEAIAAAARDNPQVRAALENEKAARERVNAAKSAYGPTIGLRFDATVTPIEPYLPGYYDRTVTGAVVVSIPLFTSGLRDSRVREAADRDSQALIGIEGTRRDVVQTLAQAWGQWTAAREALAIRNRQVEAQAVAVEGNQVEEKVGRRSVFELTNVEIELANARIDLLQTHHDEYAARAAVLAAMGRLEEAQLQAPVAPAADPLRPRGPGFDPVVWKGAVEAIDLGPRTRRPPLAANAGLSTPSVEPVPIAPDTAPISTIIPAFEPIEPTQANAPTPADAVAVAAALPPEAMVAAAPSERTAASPAASPLPAPVASAAPAPAAPEAPREIRWP